MCGAGEVHDFYPTCCEGGSAGGADGPGDGGRVKGGEELASTGNLSGGRTVFEGDESFDVRDVLEMAALEREMCRK